MGVSVHSWQVSREGNMAELVWQKKVAHGETVGRRQRTREEQGARIFQATAPVTPSQTSLYPVA